MHIVEGTMEPQLCTCGLNQKASVLMFYYIYGGLVNILTNALPHNTDAVGWGSIEMHFHAFVTWFPFRAPVLWVPILKSIIPNLFAAGVVSRLIHGLYTAPQAARDVFR